MTQEQKSLLKIISGLLDGFGKYGKYKKSYLTNKGRKTKNNEFVYPYKNSLLKMFYDVKTGNYDTYTIYNQCRVYKDELLEMEVKNEIY